MKKLTLTLCLFYVSIISYCGCPTVTALMTQSASDPDNYTLVVTFLRNGESFHIEDTIFCNGTIISAGCNTFDVTGHLNIQFTCSGTPSAKITPFLGPCGNETNQCPSINTGPSGGPTPVVLSSFSVKRNGNNVIANWRTEQEINSDKFVIERSVDNKTFQPIGSVISHGNSSVANNYVYVDRSNTSARSSFYRVKMVDKDGSITYTPAQLIRGITGKTDLSVYPNPAFGNTSAVVSDLNEPATLQVVDDFGEIIKISEANAEQQLTIE